MTDTDAKKLSGEQDSEDAKVMGLLEHLDELRARMTKSVVSVLVIFFGTFGFADQLMNFLKQPLIKALPEGSNALHFTGPMDVFIANIKISFLVAIVAGCPIWIYQFWRFIEPALYKKERKYILPFIFFSVLLFFTGVSFCYFIIVPLALEFLIGIGLEVGTPIITVSDYISVLILLIAGFGIVFETPVILVLLAMLDLISAKSLQDNRKFVLVGVLVLGALLTPPDPISQIAMGVPTYLMYEMSILIIKLIKRE